ncbi:uncharacterized protein LOC133919280 isoform X1 [Phragmites australis]|uniref:uncharacterized protein LOC133919280 isoform X1 n=1 Tax=Phragmites australis TaxID=29695 RepID=UPI002D766157|nr:uncharacterized protein LOC133919280 isoform X1 [Phragmites australis]
MKRRESRGHGFFLQPCRMPSASTLNEFVVQCTKCRSLLFLTYQPACKVLGRMPRRTGCKAGGRSGSRAGAPSARQNAWEEQGTPGTERTDATRTVFHLTGLMSFSQEKKNCSGSCNAPSLQSR